MALMIKPPKILIAPMILPKNISDTDYFYDRLSVLTNKSLRYWSNLFFHQPTGKWENTQMLPLIYLNGVYRCQYGLDVRLVLIAWWKENQCPPQALDGEPLRITEVRALGHIPQNIEHGIKIFALKLDRGCTEFTGCIYLITIITFLFIC